MYLRCSRSRNINKKTGGQSWVFVLGYIIWWPFSSQANQPLQRTKINKQQAKDGVIRIHDMIAGKHVKTTCTLKTWCPKNTKWLTSEHDVFSRKRPSFPKLKLFFACRWRKRTKRCTPPPGAPESSGRSPPKRASRKEELRWEVNLSSSREEVNFRIDFSEIRKYTIHNQCVNVEWMDMWWFELVEPRVKMKLGRPFLPVFHFPWGWATRFLEIQVFGRRLSRRLACRQQRLSQFLVAATKTASLPMFQSGQWRHDVSIQPSPAPVLQQLLFPVTCCYCPWTLHIPLLPSHTLIENRMPSALVVETWDGQVSWVKTGTPWPNLFSSI